MDNVVNIIDELRRRLIDLIRYRLSKFCFNLDSFLILGSEYRFLKTLRFSIEIVNTIQIFKRKGFVLYSAEKSIFRLG